MKKFIILSVLVSLNSFALAEGVYTVIVQKQEEKQSSRWTLAGWLATKQRIALMDQWLALHSSETWFEFIFDYASGNLDNNLTNTSYNMDRLGAAMYIKFFGLEYEKLKYSKLTKQEDFKINLLLLGSSVQSTHLRAFWGQRDYKYEGYSKYDQNLWGSSLTLYLLSFLGGEITYTKFSEETSSDKNYKMHGQRIEYGGFIDLWALRVYANLFKEKSYFKQTTTTLKEDDGVIVGAKLFL